MDSVRKLAVVISHPTQYYSPWFRHLASLPELDLKVFYLWDFGIKETQDKKFKTSFSWDIPLLEGYQYELLENVSKNPGTHSFGGLNNPEAVDRIAAWNPDAILQFGYKYITHQKIIFSSKFREIPLIFRGDSHVLYPSRGWKAWVSRISRKVVYRRFDYFLTVGQANEAYFADSGVPAHKMIRAGHCVDNERFRSAKEQAEVEAQKWRKELGIAEDTFVFVSAGKFEEKKRPLDLLRAFTELNEEKTALLFVGGGDFEDQLRAEAGEHVYFAPFQNQTKMPTVYAMADVIVLPSFGSGETWGLAVNEAMNLARPVIVSSHVGCGPDLVREGETGWIFEAGQLDSLTKVMRAACADPKKTAEMGRTAQEHIANFSYEEAGKKLLEVLRK